MRRLGHAPLPGVSLSQPRFVNQPYGELGMPAGKFLDQLWRAVVRGVVDHQNLPRQTGGYALLGQMPESLR